MIRKEEEASAAFSAAEASSSFLIMDTDSVLSLFSGDVHAGLDETEHSDSALVIELFRSA